VSPARQRPRRSLDVLVLFDVSRPVPPDHDFTEAFKDPGFETEGNVCEALRALGHQVRTHPVHAELVPLVERLTQNPPQLVFNLCESFNLRREHEAHLVGVLEMLGLPYTGVGTVGLTLCHDKSLAKKVLTFHHARTPKFALSLRQRPLKALRPLRPPVFVKPLNTESSEGIALAALATDEKSALERVAFIHERLQADALVEEYIEGRELYCGVLGNERLRALPLVELLVGDGSVGAEDAAPGAPRFFTWKAKWDEAYRKKWNIRSGPPQELPAKLAHHCQEVARRACKVLRVKGYARVDMRLKPGGELYVIEVNPNPGLARGDEFAQAAARSGLSYEALIDKIVSLAMG
jgi:D-alanine-D-alanine ligase